MKGRNQGESHRYPYYSHDEDSHNDGYGSSSRNDYARQDFDYDLDSGMFDDDF
ncbi:MAG: hypothetical protein J6C44_02050 [Muribaculaceae bacterium]|nr:hypothetical protein [Muribaculaceae bacterium]